MGMFNVTDVNDGSIYPVDSNNVNAIYELDIYRKLRLVNGLEYDVTETFASLVQDSGGGNIT